MNESLIEKISDEWWVQEVRQDRPGIFILIRDGKFDFSSWDTMIANLKRMTTPLSDREAATLARVLWLVPILMMKKLRYIEKRGFSAEDINTRRIKLEDEMVRLIGLPGQSKDLVDPLS